MCRPEPAALVALLVNWGRDRRHSIWLDEATSIETARQASARSPHPSGGDANMDFYYSCCTSGSGCLERGRSRFAASPPSPAHWPQQRLRCSNAFVAEAAGLGAGLLLALNQLDSAASQTARSYTLLVLRHAVLVCFVRSWSAPHGLRGSATSWRAGWQIYAHYFAALVSRPTSSPCCCKGGAPPLTREWLGVGA